MTDKIRGNIKGLSPSNIKALERLYSRKLVPEQLLSKDFSKELFGVAEQIGRRVGALVTREGEIAEVVVGSREILYLPDLGRYRLGEGRLRRLRLLYSDLSKGDEAPQIQADVYADLEKLRLDAVVSIKQSQTTLQAVYAYNSLGGVKTESIKNVSTFKLNFSEFIHELEVELARGEIKQSGEAAILVGVYPKSAKEAEDSIAELEELARTAGVQVVDKLIQRKVADPKTLLGKGKLEELSLIALRLGVNLIIFDTELKPSQWRAITNSIELRVIDRSMLILDIFAEHATSSDGRLQVELAQLKYNLPRLSEMDAGLSRLTGGIGGRGPGETKLEISRRRSRERIQILEQEIETFAKRRDLNRKRRRESGVPQIAIVGYTNVGKSTLFNALTKSNVLVESKLFATLELSKRKLFIPYSKEKIEELGRTGFETVLVDTVGFIRELPEELMVAFKATLEEGGAASLLLHVLDASDPEVFNMKRAVDNILKETSLAEIPSITVLNKTDLIDLKKLENLVREFKAIAVSAVTGDGLDELLRVCSQKLTD